MSEARAASRANGRARRTRNGSEPVWSEPELATPEGDEDFMTSLARGLAVIRSFTERGRGRTIAEVSRAVGIPRAAARRCLRTLERLGYVGAENGAFFLQAKVLTLGYAYLSSDMLTSSAQPVLDRASAALRESCSLGTLSGLEIVYVARAMTSKRIMSVDISIGTRLPAFCTSMGRVLLASLPPNEMERVLGRIKLEPFTPQTVKTREKLRQVLYGVRRSGHALVDQELELGLRSIAVPVRNAAGNVVAAMNVGTQAGRVGIRELETRVLPVLRAAAEELTSVLRY